SMRSGDLFQIALRISFELEDIAVRVAHLVRRALREVLSVVGFGEKYFGAVGEFCSPAVTVPACGGFVETGGGFRVLKDGVSVSAAFGDAIEIEEVCVFQDDQLVRVGIAGTDRRNIERMIAVAAKGVNRIAIDPFVRSVSSGQRNLEHIVEKQVRLAE